MFSTHRISRAWYATRKPIGENYPEDAIVWAERFDGTIEQRRANDDIEGGGMTAFLNDGGIIEPWDGGAEGYQYDIVNALKREMYLKLEADYVTLNVANGSYNFGLDEQSRINIRDALLGVMANTTPNPRPWTPKGATSPIMITHAEMTEISSAVGNAYDDYMQSYLSKKSLIKSTSNVEFLENYDPSQGWPNYSNT